MSFFLFFAAFNFNRSVSSAFAAAFAAALAVASSAFLFFSSIVSIFVGCLYCSVSVFAILFLSRS